MDKRNVRYNILIVLVYIIGIILLIQLFKLQIVHGEEYLEKSILGYISNNSSFE